MPIVKKTRVLAISPTPECICLAAGCRAVWDELFLAGGKYIEEVVRGWLAREDVAEAGVMVAGGVADEGLVAGLMSGLAARGVAVRWFRAGGSAGLAGVDGVEVVRGESLRGAVEGYSGWCGAGALAGQLSDNEDLLDFIRYKVSLSFMRGYDAGPVRECVRELSRGGGGRFSLEGLNRRDAASVRNFRDAEFPQFDGKTELISALKRRVREVGATDLGALVIGETGTGKEAVAFYLHEFSARRDGPFLPINCAALEENFLRSELFGHEKNAFTGAGGRKDGLIMRAEGGTVFLDELADMPLPIQADLLRFLQTKKFRRLQGAEELRSDVRIVAAAQPVIHEKLKSGQFRLDLYHRIAEVEIRAPRLADVPGDIVRIIRNIAYRHEGAGLDEAKILETVDYFARGGAALEGYSWPGNVRELAGFVKRRLFLGDDVLEEICARAGDLEAARGDDEGGAFARPRRLEDVVTADELLSGYIRGVDALGAPRGELAKRLGISVNTYKKYLRGKD